MGNKINIPKIYYGTHPPQVNKVITYSEPLVDINKLEAFDWLHGWDYTTYRYIITDEAQEDVIDLYTWNKTFGFL